MKFFEVFVWRTSDHIYVCLTMLSAQYYVFDLHLYVVVCAILVNISIQFIFVLFLSETNIPQDGRRQIFTMLKAAGRHPRRAGRGALLRYLLNTHLTMCEK